MCSWKRSRYSPVVYMYSSYKSLLHNIILIRILQFMNVQSELYNSVTHVPVFVSVMFISIMCV